jgi:type II secretory pathway component GspD/PulD (secretin)
MLFLLAMNIDWTEHGYPRKYAVRSKTLIKATNDFLDELVSSPKKNAYLGFAELLIDRGFIKEESEGYQFIGRLTPARKAALKHLPSALNNLMEKNAIQYKGTTKSHILYGFGEEKNTFEVTISPSQIEQMRRLLEDLT